MRNRKIMDIVKIKDKVLESIEVTIIYSLVSYNSFEPIQYEVIEYKGKTIYGSIISFKEEDII